MMGGLNSETKMFSEVFDKFKELDGNWVSLRVTGHLGPSTLRCSPVGRIAPEFLAGTLERLKAYTDVVADFPCNVKEFEW
jgi:hypothetical protein